MLPRCRTAIARRAGSEPNGPKQRLSCVEGSAGGEVQRGGRLPSRPARLLPVPEAAAGQRPDRSPADRDRPHQHTAHSG